ncbi:Fur family transcriptional regulator [Virgibacillus natechei]
MSTNISKYTIERMKDSCLKITPQRVAVLEYLLHTDSHPTADEIYKAMENRFPSISLTTVYNNLNSLCENGLVQELSFGQTSSRFDSDTTNHYHIICSNCGKMVDFHYPELKEIEAFAEQTTDFEVSHHRLDIYGKCEICCKES